VVRPGRGDGLVPPGPAVEWVTGDRIGPRGPGSGQRTAWGPLKARALAEAAAAEREPTRNEPSSKKPVRVRARVMVAWAAASPSSNRALVLRLLVVSQAWW